MVQQRKLIDTSAGDLAHRRRQAAHLDAMLALCETIECRRSQLLGYFGEDAGACGNCDTCQSPPEAWDGTIAAQKFLSAVYRLKHERGQRFGAGQVIDILLGRSTAKVAENGHDSLTVFGIGAELTESQWRGVVRQLLAQGLLTVQGDYGTLELTAGSDEVLGRRRQVMLRREPERPPRTRSARAAKTAAVPDDLPPEAAPRFEKLRAWRAGRRQGAGRPRVRDLPRRDAPADRRAGTVEPDGFVHGERGRGGQAGPVRPAGPGCPGRHGAPDHGTLTTGP